MIKSTNEDEIDDDLNCWVGGRTLECAIATLFTLSCVCFLLESNGRGGTSTSMYTEMNGIIVTQLLSINGLAINRTWTAIKSIKSGPTDLCLQNENDNKDRDITAVKTLQRKTFLVSIQERVPSSKHKLRSFSSRLKYFGKKCTIHVEPTIIDKLSQAQKTSIK